MVLSSNLQSLGRFASAMDQLTEQYVPAVSLLEQLAIANLSRCHGDTLVKILQALRQRPLPSPLPRSSLYCLLPCELRPPSLIPRQNGLSVPLTTQRFRSRGAVSNPSLVIHLGPQLPTLLTQQAARPQALGLIKALLPSLPREEAQATLQKHVLPLLSSATTPLDSSSRLVCLEILAGAWKEHSLMREPALRAPLLALLGDPDEKVRQAQMRQAI